MAGMVIVGAGECGVRAAFALRENGYTGPITLISEEGALPYERPPLSKNPGGTSKPIRSAENFVGSAIDLRLGERIATLDPGRRAVRFTDGATLSYDKLLLATGARARLFPGMKGCLTLRTDRDAVAILARLAPGARIGIVGGGFIGLELAATARKIGAEVTVVEAGPRILGRAVPGEIAEVVQARHNAEGVTVMTGAGVTGADDRQIQLADGRALDFDAVIAGVGAVPNVELGSDAGLTVDNGIVVEGNLRTSDPHIFAAGDCCNFEWRGTRVRLESWKAAQDQGAHAAAAMFGAQERFSKVPWFWSDQYDLTLQVAGLFDLARPVVRRASGYATQLVFQCDEQGRVAAAAGIGPGNAVARDIKVLEKLIEREAAVDPNVLADPTQDLKRLLKAA